MPRPRPYRESRLGPALPAFVFVSYHVHLLCLGFGYQRAELGQHLRAYDLFFPHVHLLSVGVGKGNRLKGLFTCQAGFFVADLFFGYECFTVPYVRDRCSLCLNIVICVIFPFFQNPFNCDFVVYSSGVGWEYECLIEVIATRIEL